MGRRDLLGGMIGFGELGVGLLHRTAVKSRIDHGLALKVEEREQLRARIVGGRVERGVDRRARRLRAALHAGGDEIVLRGVVRVERRLGDARLVDHPLDPDRPDPFPIEQLIGGRQNPLGDAALRADAAAGCCLCLACHSHTLPLDYTDWSV